MIAPWLRRFVQILAYALTGIGFVLLVLWAIRGARPTLECGVLDAVRAGAWTTAYGCIDKADFDPLFGLVTLISGGLLGFAAWLGKNTNVLRAASHEEQKAQDRQEMIRRVREIWIDGVLRNSLYDEVLLEMRMEKRPGVTPWGMVVRQPDGSEQPVPVGTDIANLFAEAHESLLILGAPGSGKSTMLLELTSSLLDQCDKDPSAPIPIVLNLSTQQSKHMSLDAWVVDELVRFYRVPKRLAASWVENNELALMLDGLDEVGEDGRDASAAQINVFLRQTLHVPVAICCREQEYKALTQQVEASGAVCMLPVSGEQIQDYLQRIGGDESVKIAAVLTQDAALRELAESPLMLNVMMLAAGELRPAQGSDTAKPDNARTRVFDAYLRTMLKRDRARGLRVESPSKQNGKRQEAKTTPNTYTAVDTVRWLKWLAAKMTAQKQTVFLLERMGKTWFNRSHQWLLWPLVFGLGVGLGVGLFFGLVFGLGVGLFFGLGVGLFFGLGVGLVDIRVRENVRISLDQPGLVGWWVFGLGGWLVVGLGGWLVFGPVGWVVGWVVGGLVALPVVGLISSSTALESNYQTGTPNTGTMQSFRNGLVVGLVVGLGGWLVVWLVFGLDGWLVGGLDVRLDVLLVGWLGAGLIFGLIFGIANFIKHYLLRLVLWRDGSLPLRYVRFLDYCTDRVLLRRTGGGYTFIHRTFQEYMATVDIDRLHLSTAK